MTTAIANFSTSALTMTSLEIAEYTGKDHKNIIRDIRFLLPQIAGTGALSFESSYLSAQNKALPMFTLPKDITLTLVSGYSAPMRHAIVTRWLELEAVAPTVQKIPTSFREALLLAAAQQEELEAAQLQIALSAPKVQVYDTVVANKNILLSHFCRLLPGVNTNAIKRDLKAMNYLHKTGNRYAVYSKYRDVIFGESLEDTYGNRDITVLAKGKELLTKLHAEGRLTMKVGHTAAA